MTISDARYRRMRIELLVATWMSYAGFYVTRKVFGIVKAPLKVHLGVDDFQLSHLWTVYLVTYMVGQFIAAALGKKVTSRNLLIAGMSISALANLLMGLWIDIGAGAYVPMLITMAIHGLAQATGWPHNVAMVASWTRRNERGAVMAVWGTCYQLGSLAAKALATFTFGLGGLIWSFWASSLVLAALTILFVVFAHENPRGDLDEPPAEAAGSSPPPADSSSRIDPAVVRTILAMGIIYFAFKFIRYALESWSTMILEERFALATTSAGYFSTAFDLVGFLGVFIGGIWSDRIRTRAPVIFAMSAGCLAATSALWLFGLSSAAAFVVLLGVIGFMAMGPDSLLSGAGAMDVGNAKRAAIAAGVVNGLGSIGPIVQEPAIGWLKMTSGLSSVFLLLVVVTLLATIGCALLWWRTRRMGVTL